MAWVDIEDGDVGLDVRNKLNALGADVDTKAETASPQFSGGMGINVAALLNGFAAQSNAASFTYKAVSYRTGLNNHVVMQADCAQGTEGAPVALLDTTQMFQILVRGHTGAAFGISANLLFQAQGDHGPGNLGARCSIGLVPEGAISNAEIFSFSHEDGMVVSPGGAVTTTTDEDGMRFARGTLNKAVYTVATLPAGVVGDEARVSDATAPAFGSTVVGGGAVHVPVFYNGANWVVG